MGKRKLNIRPGDRYGRLTIVEEVNNSNGFRKFKCICDCGGVKTTLLQALRSKNAVSCGCFHKEKIKEPKNRTENFGLTGTRLYNIWIGIKKRCYNSKCTAFKYYGRKGIKMCDAWNNRFLNFHDWAIKNGYSDSLTIERDDTSKNYEPGNCSWIPLSAQNSNKGNSRRVEYNGKLKLIVEIAKEKGVPYVTLLSRINKGWSIEDAVKPFVSKSEKIMMI